jgi:4-amino-4-deoxy-L-arabinose transferase-like glycosyltransferase
MVGDRTPERTAERIARIAVVVATVWYALAVCWCLGARVGAGHDALVASRGIMAENFWRWGIWGPVRQYVLEKPKPDAYYIHHPFGSYWLVGALAKVFGRHAFVPRLGPALQSIAMPPLLYAIGRRLWGPVPGALCALGYVVVPIALAFGNLAGFEVPTAFACVLTTWGYLRFSEHWQKRWMLVSLLGVAWGTNVDWNYVIFLGGALGLLTLGAIFLPPRWYGRVRIRPFVQWALLSAAIATACIVAWVWYFHQIGALEDLLKSDIKRSSGFEAPLAGVLRARSYWIDATFTPLAVFLGKVALPIFVIRVLFLRRTKEVLVLAIWLMAFVTYVKFKNGSDVHIYWPFAFATYFALALGMLTRCVMTFVTWVLVLRKRNDRIGAVPTFVFSCMAVIPVVMLPDGVDALRYGNATGGRFNEKGTRDWRDVDKAQALEWFATQMEPAAVSQIHEGMRPTWAFDWALHRPLHAVSGLPGAPDDERYYVADLEFLNSHDQVQLAATYKLIVLDHFVFVDRKAPKAPLDAYVFDERQPRLLEWYFTNGTEPVRTVRADAWATWELRNAWSQLPNPLPTGEPQTLEEIRIAHNAAIARSDTAAASRYEQQLITRLDTSVAAGFTDGTRLLGLKYNPGVLPSLSLFFRAAATSNDEFEFAIASVVDRRRFLSLVPADDKVKQLGAPFLIPPRLWKVGYIYSEQAPIHHRPGTERFAGRFEPTAKDFHAPKPLEGTGEIPLITLK